MKFYEDSLKKEEIIQKTNQIIDFYLMNDYFDEYMEFEKQQIIKYKNFINDKNAFFNGRHCYLNNKIVDTRHFLNDYEGGDPFSSIEHL